MTGPSRPRGPLADNPGMARPLLLVLLLAAPAVAADDGPGERPAPFDALVDAVAPGRWLRRLDDRRGRETAQSDKPAAPDLPLSLFLESIRPLGALQYESELSYDVAAFTGSAPTLQTASFEYVFADWNAARLELIAPRGRLEALGFGYQRTFGVHADGRFLHGGLVLPEVAVRGRGFVGGSAFYTLALKPDRESPWTLTGTVGANRAAFQNRPLGGRTGAAEGGLGTVGRRLGGERREEAVEEEARVWRTLAAGNLFYTLSSAVTVGLELDAFAHRRFGEYLALPNVTWRPLEHLFVQAGAGWYEVGGRSQAAVVVRVNLFDPSPRRGR